MALVVGLGVADIGPDLAAVAVVAVVAERDDLDALRAAMSSPPGTVPITLPAMWPVIWLSVVSLALMPSMIDAGGDYDVVGGLQGGGVVVELEGVAGLGVVGVVKLEAVGAGGQAGHVVVALVVRWWCI